MLTLRLNTFYPVALYVHSPNLRCILPAYLEETGKEGRCAVADLQYLNACMICLHLRDSYIHNHFNFSTLVNNHTNVSQIICVLEYTRIYRLTN
jgi:hypothetical protein